MEWPTRLFYWVSIITLGIVVGFGARATTAALIGPKRPALFDLMATGLATVVMSPMIWLLRGYVDPKRWSEGLSLPSISLNTAIIVGGIFVLRRQIGFEELAGYRKQVIKEETPIPRLQRRLSQDLQGDILRVSANDHFVEVATTRGAETLRLRLGDAIDEMDPVKGYCVHRSHWVAHSAITGIERENGQKIFVVLSNGDRLPVSRKYRPNLIGAGLLD